MRGSRPAEGGEKPSRPRMRGALREPQTAAPTRRPRFLLGDAPPGLDLTHQRPQEGIVSHRMSQTSVSQSTYYYTLKRVGHASALHAACEFPENKDAASSMSGTRQTQSLSYNVLLSSRGRQRKSATPSRRRCRLHEAWCVGSRPRMVAVTLWRPL